jgi:hypothetical protein
LFYRRLTSHNEFEEITNIDIKNVLTAFYNLEIIKRTNGDQPIVFGSLSDWKPYKLIPCIDYVLLRLSTLMENSNMIDSSRPTHNSDMAEIIRNKVVDKLNTFESAKVLKSIADEIPGWSCYLYDLVENMRDSA